MSQKVLQSMHCTVAPVFFVLIGLIPLPLYANDKAGRVTDKPSRDSLNDLNPLFASGQNGYHAYRIPALVKTSNGTLLAFAEGRKNSLADHGDIDLLLRRSKDNGQTWSPLQVLQDDGPHTIGNPCPTVDNETGRVFLFSNGSQHSEGVVLNGTGSRKIYISHSDDDGETWSVPIDITAATKKPDWRWYATGPCSGIQIKNGKHRGRLVIPANHSSHGAKETPWEYRCHCLYSDDHGTTWLIGEPSSAGANETQIAEAGVDLLIQDIRMQTHGQGVRAVRYSENGGVTWSALTHDISRKDPRCQGSVISHDEVLISSNPNSSNYGKRENLSVYVSHDHGQNWRNVISLYPGPSAYSNLAVTDDGNLACLFEAGERSPYEGIFCAFLPIDELALAENSKSDHEKLARP